MGADPDQVPLLVDRVWPTEGAPVTTGGVRLCGGVPPAAWTAGERNTAPTTPAANTAERMKLDPRNGNECREAAGWSPQRDR